MLWLCTTIPRLKLKQSYVVVAIIPWLGLITLVIVIVIVIVVAIIPWLGLITLVIEIGEWWRLSCAIAFQRKQKYKESVQQLFNFRLKVISNSMCQWRNVCVLLISSLYSLLYWAVLQDRFTVIGFLQKLLGWQLKSSHFIIYSFFTENWVAWASWAVCRELMKSLF